MKKKSFSANIITDPAQFETLRDRWNQLLSLHPAPEVFYGIEWSLANIDVPGTRLLTVVITAAETVVGIVPLCRRERTIDFIAAGLSDYNDMICAPENAAHVLEIALVAVRRFAHNARVYLSNVREDSLVYTAVRRSSGMMAIRMTKLCDCPCIRISENKVEHLRSLYSKKSLVRHSRSIGKKGDLAFNVYDRYADVAPHLNHYFTQQAIRRAVSGQYSAYRNASGRQRAQILMQHQSADKCLRVAVLRLNGKAIAYHYGFLKHGKYYWYKPSFDIAYWDDSPGEVLIRYLLISLENESIREFDFTIGEEPFKDRFANARVACYRARIYPAYAAIPLRLGERVKRWTAFARGIDYVRQRLFTLHSRISHAFCVARTRLDGVAGVVRATRIKGLATKAISREITVGVFVPGACINSDANLDNYAPELDNISELMRHIIEGCDRYSPGDMPALFKRFRRGDRVALLRDGDTLIHVSWYAIRDKLDISYELSSPCIIPLSGPRTIIYDCWTHPSYRGRGIYPAVLKWLDRKLSAVAPVCVYCRLDNRASVKGIEKAGFARSHTVTRRVRWLISSRITVSEERSICRAS